MLTILATGVGHQGASNLAFTAYSEHSAAESLGQEHAPAEFRQPRRRLVCGLLARPHHPAPWSGETRNRRKSGETFMAPQTINAILDAQGATQRNVTVFTDVTVRWQQDERLLAVLLLDLDPSRAVSGPQGHGVGDALLKVVARRLITLVRTSDCVARLGVMDLSSCWTTPAAPRKLRSSTSASWPHWPSPESWTGSPMCE